MKIGILTFHRAINYGALLQTYAMKTFLESSGHDVEVIDYWPEGHDNAYRIFNVSLFDRLSITKKIKYVAVFLLRFQKSFIRKKRSEDLVRKLFSLNETPRYSCPEDLKDVDCDCIIYGSDQIWWNSTIPGYEGFDSVYWGSYVSAKIKKISYAASMGVISLSETEKRKIRGWLEEFSSLSVREEGLRQVLSEITEKEIVVTSDPVFLLSRQKWASMFKPIKTPDRYVLLFNLMNSKECELAAVARAKESGCEVLEVTASVDPSKRGRHVIQTADAFEFLYLIANAEFVVTSSFHCTAFSVIFQKDFLSLGMGRNSGRVSSLLTKLDLVDRMSPETHSGINYAEVSERLENYINSSMVYLNSVV